MSTDHSAATRTFPGWLRALDDEALTELVRRRPDLLDPPPQDLADIASRATTATSIGRVLRQLNAWQELVLEALAAVADDAEIDEVIALLGPVDRDDVVAAVSELQRWGLVWGPSATQFRLVREARVAAGPAPGGLAPPSPQPLPVSTARRLVAALPTEERALVERLAWGPPTGRMSDVTNRPAEAPVSRLIAKKMLRVVDSETVLLPREVAWQLRSPQQLRRDQPAAGPPTLGREATIPMAARLARSASVAVGAGFELVHAVEAGCEWAAENSPTQLRDGGLGVRDLQSLAHTLNTSATRAAFVIEVAHAAHLVAFHGPGTLAPTTHYDQWLGFSSAQRWLGLFHAWLALPRWPARATQPQHHALGIESAWPVAPEVRELALQVVTEVPPGQVVSAAELSEALGWLRPGWARAGWLSESVTQLLSEWDWWGLVSTAGLGPTFPDSAVVTELLAPSVGRNLPPSIADTFPDQVSEIIVQTDLTAVAPGPLLAEVARVMRLIAESESHGAGAVYRFTAASIRRAFDAGWSQERLLAWLSEHSATPVPQPLEYLVADTARRHGAVRVGAAWCYVRTDDEAQAQLIANHPDAASLGLRLVGPGVLIASAEPDDVVGLLQQIGLHPAAEDAFGQALTAPKAVRATAPQVRPRPQPDPASTIAQLRATERRGVAIAAATDSVIETVQKAVAEGTRLDVQFVRDDGTQAHVVAVPLALLSGTVRFAGEGKTWSVPLARISGAAALP